MRPSVSLSRFPAKCVSSRLALFGTLLFAVLPRLAHSGEAASPDAAEKRMAVYDLLVQERFGEATAENYHKMNGFLYGLADAAEPADKAALYDRIWANECAFVPLAGRNIHSLELKAELLDDPSIVESFIDEVLASDLDAPAGLMWFMRKANARPDPSDRIAVYLDAARAFADGTEPSVVRNVLHALRELSRYGVDAGTLLPLYERVLAAHSPEGDAYDPEVLARTLVDMTGLIEDRDEKIALLDAVIEMRGDLEAARHKPYDLQDAIVLKSRITGDSSIIVRYFAERAQNAATPDERVQYLYQQFKEETDPAARLALCDVILAARSAGEWADTAWLCVEVATVKGGLGGDKSETVAFLRRVAEAGHSRSDDDTDYLYVYAPLMRFAPDDVERMRLYVEGGELAARGGPVSLVEYLRRIVDELPHDTTKMRVYDFIIAESRRLGERGYETQALLGKAAVAPDPREKTRLCDAVLALHGKNDIRQGKYEAIVRAVTVKAGALGDSVVVEYVDALLRDDSLPTRILELGGMLAKSVEDEAVRAQVYNGLLARYGDNDNPAIAKQARAIRSARRALER